MLHTGSARNLVNVYYPTTSESMPVVLFIQEVENTYSLSPREAEDFHLHDKWSKRAWLNARRLTGELS